MTQDDLFPTAPPFPRASFPALSSAAVDGTGARDASGDPVRHLTVLVVQALCAGEPPAPSVVQTLAEHLGLTPPGVTALGQTTRELAAARRAQEPPAQRHSKTSVAAAEQVKPNAGQYREMVYTAIAGAGSRGLTDEEIDHETHLGGNTVRPRRRELIVAGRVIDSGRLRPTTSRRQATVWVAVEHA